MPGLVFGERIATRPGQMLGAIDDPKIARAHFVREPFGRYQTIHNFRVLLAQFVSPLVLFSLQLRKA